MYALSCMGNILVKLFYENSSDELSIERSKFSKQLPRRNVMISELTQYFAC